MFQKIPILGDTELQIGDKFSFPHWAESDGYYQVTNIDDIMITFIHSSGGINHYYYIKHDRSFYGGFRPYKILDFVTYDPNQMISDEDDL